MKRIRLQKVEKKINKYCRLWVFEVEILKINAKMIGSGTVFFYDIPKRTHFQDLTFQAYLAENLYFDFEFH